VHFQSEVVLYSFLLLIEGSMHALYCVSFFKVFVSLFVYVLIRGEVLNIGCKKIVGGGEGLVQLFTV
jgi:hypothetical protein